MQLTLELIVASATQRKELFEFGSHGTGVERSARMIQSDKIAL
jgi:hypothetical protein